ncbi:MAG: PASTA domain-containing protein [Clostridia bacterium]|nr:PASTA domain-containing protein [Clostridia bacterium]
MDQLLRRRVLMILSIFLLIFMAVIGKLIWTLVFEGEDLRAVVQADKNYEAIIPSKRGSIFERKGQLLAYEDTHYKISIRINDGDDIYSDKIKAIVRDIAPLLEMSESEINEILANRSVNNRSVFIKYVEDRKIADKLRFTFHEQLGVDSVIERKYPNGYLASDILGYTLFSSELGKDYGQIGIEYMYERDLQGDDGFYRAEVDRNKIELVYSDPVLMPARDGDNIYLTIDGVLQYHLEEALKQVFIEQDAVAAHGLILNVKTGEILAMASFPNFNPETRALNLADEEAYVQRTEQKVDEINYYVFKNDWIQSVYDLGSPVKLLTAAIALENDLYTLDTKFQDRNMIIINGQPIKAWYYPRMIRDMDLREAIAQSSNPAFVEMGLKMGGDMFYDYFNDFGLYDITNIDLPFEIKGISFSREALENDINLANATFGQGSTYTPLQLAMALGSLVNDGNLMEPHVVKSIVTSSGETVYEAKPTVVRNVVSSITSQQIREAMRYTVENGSGSSAQIEGLSVGGKTGTAQKLAPDKTYYEDRAIASFVAVAPMEDPEYLVYILVDDPIENIFGSQVCGPIAKSVMEDVADMYDLYHYDSDTEMIVVPNVVGLTVKEAMEVLEKEGLYGKVQASRAYSEENIITVQYPAAESLKPKGKAILLEVTLD